MTYQTVQTLSLTLRWTTQIDLTVKLHFLCVNGLSARDADYGKPRSSALTVETVFAISVQQIAGIAEPIYVLPAGQGIDVRHPEDRTLGS